MKRRDFIKIAGIGAGTSLLPGCTQVGEEKYASAVDAPPEGTIPGEPYYLRTTCTECPANCGVEAKLVDGRVIKLDGIKGHPLNDGRLCIRGQAAITRLYNPERLKSPLRRSPGGEFQKTTWEDAYGTIAGSLRDTKAAGLTPVYLSGRTTGSLSGLISKVCAALGIERAPELEVFNYGATRRANQIVFGRYEVPHFRIGQSDLLLTVGADILQTFGNPVSNAQQLSRAKEQQRFRWMHVEPHVSLEGLNADRRFVIKPGTEPVLLAFLLDRITGPGSQPIAEAAAETGIPTSELTVLANAVRSAAKPLVIAGGVSVQQEAGLETAILASRIQKTKPGAAGLYDFARAASYENVGTLVDAERLSKRLASGQIGVLFVAGADPAGMLPDALEFEANLKKAKLVVGMGDWMNDTMRGCDLILPLSHSLESWGDAVPERGTRSIIQPVMARLYDTKSEGEILLDFLEAIAGKRLAKDARAYVEGQWKQAGLTLDGRATEKGYLTDSAVPAPKAVVTAPLAAPARGKPAPMGEDVLIVTPSLRFYDGRSRNLQLLSEIPDPLTTVTYGPFVSIPGTSGQESEDDAGSMAAEVVKLQGPGWSVEMTSKTQPRLAGGLASIDRAYLRPVRTGFDQRTGEMLSYIRGVRVHLTGRMAPLPVMSGSPSQHGRGIIPTPAAIEEHRHEEEHIPPGHETLYPEHRYKKYRWSMSVDLEKCTGCSACVSACHIENNVPMVGREQHLRGREMSWIRIEPFYDASAKGTFIPVMCQQCDSAPCEAVCPVFAAYHNEEGLNAQIYNRCVGTRYCANNCPYKVRRFNWFDFGFEKPLNKMLNPAVSVRGRGIMEKCTFCVQRIRAGHDLAKDENRDVRDGEIMPACAQTCPSNAITFGNALDEESRFSRSIQSERAYRIYEELGTGPAVHYLARFPKEEEA